MGIETNQAASNTDIPLFPIYQDPLDNRPYSCNLNHEGIHFPNEDDTDDEDGGDVDGPRVEVHVNLSKMPCK